MWDVTQGFRLVWLYDFNSDEKYGLHPTDHPGSGGSNDPYIQIGIIHVYH